MSVSTAPIPIVMMTGFLGSGKTTLLNALLRHNDMNGTAVLVNEIGAIGIDHDLVIGTTDDILLLEGDCLCCQPQGSLSAGVSRLLALDPSPNRIVIETSGAANPFPVLETLIQHPAASSEFAFPRVITVLDSVFGLESLSRYAEASFQLAAADMVVISKTDLSNPSTQTVIQKAAVRINPVANYLDGRVEGLPEKFLAMLGRSNDFTDSGLQKTKLQEGHIHGENEFETVGIKFDGRLEVAKVQEWIDQVLETYGNNLLRIKGIMSLNGYDKPAILQCVRDIVYPIETLETKAMDLGKNSIVAIGWDMHPELIREFLNNLAVLATENLPKHQAKF